MKLDRRSFLSLGLGATAGTVLSPLPWKLTDDSSIWTQNWPWTPVPVDGEVTFEDSVCTLCPGKCGITVRNIAGRPVKIEGKDGFPVNDGGICALGASGLQFLYGPTRVQSPMKKVDGKWQSVSWDEAVALVAAKLGELAENGASDSLACVSGSASPALKVLFKRFLAVYGSPNFTTGATVLDAYALAVEKMQGTAATPVFDVKNADYVLSFGSGLIDGWVAPAAMISAHSSLRDKKGTLVQAEPRYSNTAAAANKWLPVKPGTEELLALGITAVILKESLYKKKFVKNTKGFDAWKKSVLADFAPDKVAAETGIPAADIASVARAFAKAKKPLAICGRGNGSTPVTLNEAMAVHALNGLVGAVNREGGVFAVPEPALNALPEVAAAEGAGKKRADGADGENLIHRLAAVVNRAKDASPIQMLMVDGANPCFTQTDTKAFLAAVEKIPFVVSFSPYMDETAEAADLILPDNAYLEKTDGVFLTSALGKPSIGLLKPVIAPALNTMNTGDALILIAQAMEGTMAEAFGWENYDECLAEVFGDKFETLSEEGLWVDAGFAAPAWEKAFTTQSGKFEFPAKAVFTPVTMEGAKGFPLVLVPVDSMRVGSGFVGQSPFNMKTVSDAVLIGDDSKVEINTATAKELGLKEGAEIELATVKGKVKVKAHISPEIMPGVVGLHRGFGHTAYDGYVAGKGVNFNELIGPVEDPDSGLDVALAIRAKISKA